MSNEKKTTMTFTGNLSVDCTFITRDLAIVEDSLKELEDFSKSEEFCNHPIKKQVMIKLVLEAYHKDGLEGGIRELVRFNIREIMNEVIRRELASDEENMTIKVAPCRLKLGVAEKVLNGRTEA